MSKSFEEVSSRIDLFMEDEENKLYIVSSSSRMGIELVEVLHSLTKEIEEILEETVSKIKSMDDMEVEVIQMKIHEMMNLFYSKVTQEEAK